MLKKYKILIPLVICVGVLLVYWQGVYFGIGVLDDQHVLMNLLKVDGQPWLDGFINYLNFKGSFVSRPISYLSFYLQKEQFSSDLSTFKIANVGLHSFNTLIVFFLSKKIAKDVQSRKPWLVAALCAIVWGLSPIQVSSVLYITQRMAELSALFSFSALLLFVYSKSELNPKKQFCMLFFGASPLVVLGILCKENAILTLLSILILDFTIYARHPTNRLYSVWKAAVVVGPLMLLVVFFVMNFEKYFVNAYASRDFSLYERVITQSRILIEYLAKTVLFSAYDFGAVNTFFAKSISLTEPVSTLFCIALWITCASTALICRQLSVVFSFGVLFFLGNHVLESSVLGLELYFEHRNYIAIFGVAFVLSYFWVNYIDKIAEKKWLRLLAIIALCVYLSLMVFKTLLETQMWSKPVDQAVKWYQSQPLSQRTHSHLGRTLVRFGLYQQAERFYEATIDDFPNDPTKALLWAELSCFDPAVVGIERPLLSAKLRSGEYFEQTLAILDSILALKGQGRCEDLDLTWFLDVTSDLLENSNYKDRAASLHVIRAEVYQNSNNALDAAAEYQMAILYKWRLDIALSLTEKYLMLGKLSKAKDVFSRVEDECNISTKGCVRRKTDIVYLRSEIAKWN